MGLSTHSSFIKIRDAVLADGSITLADVKMPSFDPRALGITFTDPEKAYLKRYWGNHWQMGMKSFLVRAMEEKKDDDIEKGLVKDAFQALFATLEADDIDRDRAKKIMRRWLDKDGAQ